MNRKLSTIEHMIDGNIVYVVRLAGHFQPQRLRTALARLRYKHPALRMLVREQRDGLYYEFDAAPEIPLRILPRLREDDYRSESVAELRHRFPRGQPQLRVVWLRSDLRQDLLFVSSHRICDGMSMLTIVREVLRCLHRDEIPVAYPPISPDDIVGDYRPSHPRTRRMLAHLCNALLSLVPSSRRSPGNHEYCLEWSVGREMSDALRRRCRSEGVSVHAALTVALDRALLAALGERKVPAWIESPMDARRGRLAILGKDMLFFGGGSLRLRTSGGAKENFWDRARTVHRQLRGMIDQELQSIPGRFQFYSMLRPLSDARIHTLVRIADALRINGSWNRIALSNLGDVIVTEPDAPFRLLDLRLYVHSFNIRLLGLVSYFLNDQMRFYYVGDEKCMSPLQAQALQREMVALLQNHVAEAAPWQQTDGVDAQSLAG